MHAPSSDSSSSREVVDLLDASDDDDFMTFVLPQSSSSSSSSSPAPASSPSSSPSPVSSAPQSRAVPSSSEDALDPYAITAISSHTFQDYNAMEASSRRTLFNVGLRYATPPTQALLASQVMEALLVAGAGSCRQLL